MCAFELIFEARVKISNATGLFGGHLYYFLNSVYPFMPHGRQVIFVPTWYEHFIDKVQRIFGSITGLQHDLPVPAHGFTPG